VRNPGSAGHADNGGSPLFVTKRFDWIDAVCLVGNFDQQPPSPKQIAATKALIDYLNKRYNIAPEGLRTHAHLAATKTVCPGKFFPSEAMLMATKDAMTERPVRATWKVVRDTTQR
jgi:N-acetyl-anhydromuramyl-L-alanine amidase AmpD